MAKKRDDHGKYHPTWWIAHVRDGEQDATIAARQDMIISRRFGFFGLEGGGGLVWDMMGCRGTERIKEETQDSTD